MSSEPTLITALIKEQRLEEMFRIGHVAILSTNKRNLIFEETVLVTRPKVTRRKRRRIFGDSTLLRAKARGRRRSVKQAVRGALGGLTGLPEMGRPGRERLPHSVDAASARDGPITPYQPLTHSAHLIYLNS